MTTVLFANGLLEIPEVFRKADDLRPGQVCEIERMSQGDYRVRIETMVKEKEPRERLLDVLQSCPVKDWWVEPDRSERTSLEPSSLFAA